ncbi:BRO-N domain-containing protein [Neisseria sp. Ec49-e6-T10]|uniref:BRO-N domain-containing protein n=1 Tax=Neisseria sp. Ec49-e6-T10 TaxID=3140744 RepID=UPI003EBC125E
MSNLIPFSFENHPVQTLTINDELWFVAKDIMNALEYAESSRPSKVISHIPEEWKGVKQIHTLGGKQRIACISEQGLYFFLGRSDKPKALPFQKWLAGEVLPSIRKTGEFSNKETLNLEGYNELNELNQLIGNILDFRFLLTFDEQKKPRIRILSYDDLIFVTEDIPKLINNRLNISEELLLKIIQACTKRLTMMASCRLIEEKIKK